MSDEKKEKPIEVIAEVVGSPAESPVVAEEHFQVHFNNNTGLRLITSYEFDEHGDLYITIDQAPSN